jgi:tetratricopeptide (TPR) repeat protein
VSYRDPAEADALRARAAEHLSTSLALWPYDPETLFNRAAASATAADKIAAMRAYLAVVPADKLARVGLAQALADDGQLPAAEETLQMVLVEKNAPAEAYHRLIGLYLRDAKYEPALQTADEAMKKFPANMQIVIDMADVYRIKGDHARAVPLYQQALVTQRDEPGIYLRAGLSYMALGDYAKAEQVFASGSKLAPRNTQFLVYLARLELASNRRAEARRHLFSALQYDPELANNLREVAPELQPLLKEQTQP